MTTAIEYALMAGASYISTRDDVNRFPVPQGWTKVINPDSYFRDPNSGFEAIAYTNGTEIVISFAGTDGYGGGIFTNPDMQADAALGLGLWSDQLGQAAAYYLEIKALNPGATITFTGHSLGGGLASFVSVFFGETAMTFDQAPFRAALAQAQNLKSYLLTHEAGIMDAATLSRLLEPLDRYITAMDPNNLDPIVADIFATRQTLVTDINVQGEFLSTGAWTLLGRIGTQADIRDNTSGVSGDDLHSQALLSAYLQSRQTAATGKALNDVTFKLTDLLGMIFNPKLFAYSTAKSNTTDENFLERLVKHEATVIDPATGETDAMVKRFTSDLWTLAQDGGLTLKDGSLVNPNAHYVSNALIAFAMQKYYEETTASAGYKKELFTDLATAGEGSGGIRFDMADVAAKFATAFQNSEKLNLKDAKGFDLYFKSYLLQATFTDSERQLIQSLLPYMRDWYVQAGADGMTATDMQNRGAFMLGGTGNDSLTGGSGADLLVGNAGNDGIFCATTTDRMRWRTVAAIVNSGKAANDEAIHAWRAAA